jgi:hypothetical protein
MEQEERDRRHQAYLDAMQRWYEADLAWDKFCLPRLGGRRHWGPTLLDLDQELHEAQQKREMAEAEFLDSLGR